MSASPAPATPPTPAKPEVPKATKTLSARNFAALEDDPTIGDVAQTMKSIDAAQAANARDNVDVFVATAMPGGSAAEVIRGKTITGKEVPVSQRVMMAGIMMLPFVPEGAGKLSKVGSKVNGEATPVAKAGSNLADHFTAAPAGRTAANSVMPKIVQYGDNTLRESAARQIIEYNNLNPRNYNRGVLGNMLEDFKRSLQLPPNHHGNIGIDGSYYSPDGVFIGNFLP